MALFLKADGIYISAHNKDLSLARFKNSKYKIIGSAHNIKELNLKIDNVEKENIYIKNLLENCKNELLMNQRNLNEVKENADNSKRELNEYKRKAVFQRIQAAESLKRMTSLYETMVGNNDDDQIHILWSLKVP